MINQEKELVVFLHVPKSGGTSVRTTITGGLNYGRSGEMFSWHGNSIELKKEVSSDVIDKIRFITGHCSFGIHQVFSKPTVYFSVVRHPVNRMISFFFQRTMEYDFLKNWTIEDMLTQEVFDQFEEFHTTTQNKAVAMISGTTLPDDELGEEQLEQAKYNIDKYFSFICCTEDLDCYWNLLSDKFGYQWDSDMEERNKYMHVDHKLAKEVRPQVEDIPSYIKDQILETHSLDVKLYNYVKSVQDKINDRKMIYCHRDESNG